MGMLGIQKVEKGEKRTKLAGGSGKRFGCSSHSSVGHNSWIPGILGLKLKDKKGSKPLQKSWISLQGKRKEWWPME